MSLPKVLQRLMDYFRRNPAPPENAPVQNPDPTQIPEPAPALPTLTPLMLRVKHVQETETVQAYDNRRRFRHCFHEARHAFVGHYCGEDVERILVDVAKGERPRAVTSKKNLQAVNDAFKAGKSGTKEILIPLKRHIAQMAAGEIGAAEVGPTEQRISTGLDDKTWELALRSPQQTDRGSIIVIMRAAGFKGRTDVVQEAEQLADKIVADHRRLRSPRDPPLRQGKHREKRSR